MTEKKIIRIIEWFIDKNFPKGNKDRGFALVVLSMFLLDLGEKDSPYKLIDNGKKRK